MWTNTNDSNTIGIVTSLHYSILRSLCYKVTKANIKYRLKKRGIHCQLHLLE